jgi:hypothetical protein
MICEENLSKVFSTLLKDWDERLPIFLLAYRESTHEATGMTLRGTVFGKDLHLPCVPIFGANPNKEQSMTDSALDLVKQLHYIIILHAKI